MLIHKHISLINVNKPTSFQLGKINISVLKTLTKTSFKKKSKQTDHKLTFKSK